MKRKTTERKVGSGCITRKMKTKKKRRLRLLFNNKNSMSQRKAARLLKMSQPTINYWLKKIKIKCRKRIKSPKYTQTQAIMAQRKCLWLYRKYRKFDFILDDEKYFTLSNTTIAGNRNFYTSKISECPPEVSHAGKRKFEKKVLLWVAISPKGISKSVIKSSKLAINQKIYKNQCLKKCLLPFIREKHKDNFIFWPDLASAHYGAISTSFLRENKIPFVDKQHNPANVPQCRPVEDFFAILSAKVYEGGWEADNVTQLKSRIKRCLKKIDLNLVQTMMKKVKGRLRKCGENGVYSVVH
jgi:hypothetical protein